MIPNFLHPAFKPFFFLFSPLFFLGGIKTRGGKAAKGWKNKTWKIKSGSAQPQQILVGFLWLENLEESWQPGFSWIRGIHTWIVPDLGLE